jgi:glycosyltransferase involved in cell wall biosynthesis
MMSGMPIVTTATCGMKDVIRDAENGILVPTHSPHAIVAAVERLLGDVDYRARLGRAAQAEALDKYVWERVARPICAVYEQLADR